MNALWQSDEDLFALSRRELYTAVVGDIMDILGYKRQFLPPSIQPLRDDMVVIGRAMPVLEMDDEGGEGPGRPLEGYRVDVRFYDADLLEVIHIGPSGMTVRPTLVPEADGSVLDRIHAGSAGQAHHGGLPDGCFTVPRAHTGGAPVAPSSCQEVLELNGLGYLFPYYQLTGLPDTSTDAEWGQPSARTPFGVVVTLTDAAGDVRSQCFYAFNFPWHQDAHQRAMTRTSIRACFGKWLDERRGSMVVSNEGPRLCPWVDVTSPDLAPDAFALDAFALDAFALDDNFFSLRAGETRTIGFTLRGGGGSGEPRFSARGINIET